MPNELLSNQWISDQTLHKYFYVINDIFSSKHCSILDPIVSYAIKSVTYHGHVHREHLHLENIDYIFVPINDSKMLGEGSHWRGLLVSVKDKCNHYFDSLNNKNVSDSGIVLVNISSYLYIKPLRTKPNL